MNADCPIHKTETPSALRLEWDNCRARQDRLVFWFLLFWWAIWVPLTVWVTSIIFRSDSDALSRLGCFIWSALAWPVALLIPYLLLQRYWCEWIAISKESLVCGRRGFLAPRPKSIPAAAVSEIRIGHYYEPGDSESYESSVTLNVFYFTPKGRKSRHMVGYWLHPTLKEKVFCDIQEFAEKHAIPLTFRRD
jgi:hypothetical protein